jgi:CheY-like chemotaxis protein
LADIPVIGLTADVTAEQQRRCKACGMSDVALKPLSQSMLATLAARYLAPRHPVSGEMAPAPEPVAATPRRPDFDSTSYHDMFDPADPEGPAWLEEFVVAAGDMMEALRRQVGEGVPVAETAHRLAGAALSVGAISFGEAARSLERAGATDIAARFDDVETAFVDARAAMVAFARVLVS